MTSLVELFRVIRKKAERKNAVMYHIKDLNSEKESILQLQDIWCRQVLNDGCLISIVDAFIDDESKYIVSRDQGFVILEPDELLSVTSILRQMWCQREAVLSEKMTIRGGGCPSTLKGNICHQLMAKAITKKLRSANCIRNALQEVIRGREILEQAYSLNFSQKELEDLSKDLIPHVAKFMAKRFFSTGEMQTWRVTGVRDIEDVYWNPKFGLKGSLDATVDIRKPDGTEATIPLEVKTGNEDFTGKQKVRDDHVGQVHLYSLLISTRYPDVKDGLLFYVSENFWKECSLKLNNLQALILMRNDLIRTLPTKLGRFINLPRPERVEFERQCSTCTYKNMCSVMLQHDFSKDKDLIPTLTETKLLSATPHLSRDEVAFFYKWITFVALEIEAANLKDNAKMLWQVPSSERSFTCIPLLEISNCVTRKKSDSSSYFEVTFKSLSSVAETNFHRVGLNKFDYLYVGTDEEPFIGGCTVESATSHPLEIVVHTEKSFEGRSKNGLFTLDKLNSFNPASRLYSYLALLARDTPEMKRLREYIILKKKPVFQHMNRDMLRDSEPILRRYFKHQIQVLVKALGTDSFLFVKGVPGAGKTETIVGLIEILVSKGKTVVVVGYTSTAVDNILCRYKHLSSNFVRIGKERYVKPELSEFTHDSLTKSIQNVDDLRAALGNPPVVATTLLSMNNGIFENRKFDYAILDEVSQAVPIACLGALIVADKYILFGDPEQLPPVVSSPAVRILGYEESIFEMMSTPENTFQLNMQFRMNGTIMNLANKLTYNNQMTCFSGDLEKAYLSLPTKNLADYLKSIPKARQEWLTYVVSKRLVRSVVFLDTSKLRAHDSVEKNSIKNDLEVTIVAECLKAFFKGGLPVDELGVIAPYRAQVNAIRKKCEELDNRYGGIRDIEVNTVDQYQGRDKKTIICSFTKSRLVRLVTEREYNENVESDAQVSILEDQRRLNVAITRAKRKLVMVGHKDFLKQFQPFKSLFNVLLPEQLIPLTTEDMSGLV